MVSLRRLLKGCLEIDRAYIAPHPPAPQTPRQILSPSEGSASDDEMSATARSGSYASPKDASRKPTNVITSPMLPHRPRLSEDRDVAMGDDDQGAESEKDMPTSPVTSSPTISPPPKRSSAVPPIPSHPPVAPSQAPQGRAPHLHLQALLLAESLLAKQGYHLQYHRADL